VVAICDNLWLNCCSFYETSFMEISKLILRIGFCVNLFILTGTMNAATESKEDHSSSKTQQATFGGGCFWCFDAIFKTEDGVKKVTSGYAGGKTSNPTYEQVCAGATGHAEVVQIEFDPAKVSYEQLLDLFWRAHDPTTLNRQGADHGTQYRSIILYHNEAQKQAAEKSKHKAAGQFKDPIVTEIISLKEFYSAEGYHQDYYKNNPRAPYCTMVIHPKLEKLKKH